MAASLPAPVFLVSPDGMLGRAFVALLGRSGIAFGSASYPSLDISDPASVERALLDRYRLVINCSAFTDVDGAETREAEADAVNATGVAHLAERCRKLSAALVHFSTDYVFDGRASTPYSVDHPRDPQSAYGRSKARGEERLEASGCAYLQVRTSWLYAPWGKNFVDTIAKAGAARPLLRVVDDQRGRPTSAQYLAARTLALLEHGARGTFHVTDGGECSWFEFAAEIVQRTGGRAQVEPCTSEEMARPAPRPAYSVLDLGRTEALIGAARPWRDNLADVLRERASESSKP